MTTRRLRWNSRPTWCGIHSRVLSFSSAPNSSPRFWLARPASEISLADIIRAIDGQLLGVPGEPPEDVNYPGPAEPMRRVWIALRAFGPTVLETVTLGDIVSGELWLLALVAVIEVHLELPTVSG